jgi:SAM-dependent methyltransferase
MATHNERYARTLVSMLDADSHDLFVEIASNDGSLLARLQAQGVRVLGVEPARNIAAMARDRGIETVERFFDQSAAAAIVESHGLARGVIANNVLAHVDDTVGFLSACRALLAPNGMVSIEVPYAREMLERLEYDTVYHEHLCYFSVASLLRLFERAGLTIVRIDRVAVHGGSLRVYAVPDSALDTHARQVMAMAEEERHHGLASLERWRRFAADVAANRRALRDVLRALVDSGKVIAAYGAPAKGNTLLNYCGIGTETLQYVVDRNALKVGTYTPGVHLPVLPVSTLESRPPDFLLVLAWNFIDEIMTQLPEFRQRGGRFIVPIPAPSLVG